MMDRPLIQKLERVVAANTDAVRATMNMVRMVRVDTMKVIPIKEL